MTQLDTIIAFLYGDLDEAVYLMIREGFAVLEGQNDAALHSKRTVYGLKRMKKSENLNFLSRWVFLSFVLGWQFFI